MSWNYLLGIASGENPFQSAFDSFNGFYLVFLKGNELLSEGLELW